MEIHRSVAACPVRPQLRYRPVPRSRLRAAFAWAPRLLVGGRPWYAACDARWLALAPAAALGRRGPVISLELAEIAVVRCDSELSAVHDAQGEARRADYEWIELHLRHSRTQEITELCDVLPRGDGRAPLEVPQPGLLRLVWSGPDFRIVPDAAAASARFGQAATAAPAAEPESDWRNMSSEALGDYIVHLYDTGNYTEATAILRARESREEKRGEAGDEAPTAPAFTPLPEA